VPQSKSILTISRNPELQGLRTLVLRQAGYEVAAALDDTEAIRLFGAPNSFDLVLLCHSVPESSRVELVNKIKALKSTVPVLMLYNGHDPTHAKVDGSLHNLDSPQGMLRMIDFLMRNAGH
jgi:DNA-binding response OmpR family regulator